MCATSYSVNEVTRIDKGEVVAAKYLGMLPTRNNGCNSRPI
jgi:hypothetical protein